MPPTSAAMELKVLISILQSGTALQTLLNQTNQLSAALSTLQKQAAAGSTATPPPIVPGLQAAKPAADDATKALEKLEGSINKVVRAAQFLAGGFLALQSVRFLKNLADAAAQNQVLGTVLHVVALNAGITAEEIDKVDKKVQRLGITIAASRQALTQFLQARLDLKFAPALARAAQDLAVISGVNSSDTFRRLIVNIQQLDTLGLRMMGLVIDRTAAEKKYKEEIGATTRELTKRESQTALTIAILEKAKGMEGAYSTAMNDAAKQLTSLDRLTETYRSALGDSLLPAYSAIIAEVSTMFEKLVLLAQEFSSNSQRANELAETVRTLAQWFTSAAIFVMEHLNGIITLVKWYLELKAVLLFFRGAEATLVWLIKAIDWFNKLRLAIIAVRSGMVTFGVAMQAMSAQSVAAAGAQLELAAAQAAVAASAAPAAAGVTGVGLAATGTTMAVRGLMLAWGSLAAVLAIPVVGFIIYKMKAKMDEEAAKPFLVRAGEARKNLMPFEKGEKPIFFTFFEQWKRDHPEIVAMLKEEEALLREFGRQIDAATKTFDVSNIVDSLSKARQELTAAQTARQELLNPPGGEEGLKATLAEREAADERVNIATEALAKLRDQMEKTFRETLDISGTKEVFAQFDKVRDLQRELGRVRADPKTGRKELADAEAALETEKLKLAVMIEQKEERLKTANITNEQRLADERALAHLKAELTALGDSVEAITTARQQVFGGKFVFGEEGVTSGAFGKAFGGYQTMVTEANKLLERTGKIPKELADSLRLGLEAVGEAAKTPLDLSNLRKMVPELQNMEKNVPGITKKLRDALEVARQGVQKEVLSFRAPIVSEAQERLRNQTGKEVEVLKQRLDKLKNIGAAELAELDQRQKNNEISLGQYFRARREIIAREGAAEIELLQETLSGQLNVLALEEDALKRPGQRLQIEQTRGQIRRVYQETEKQQTDLTKQQQDRTRQLVEQTTAGLKQFAATAGGEAEAIAELYHRIREERKKNVEPLEGEERFRADELLYLKLVTEEYEIHRKFRQQALEMELKRLDLIESQLELERSRRGIDEARDRRLEATGEITAAEALRRRNQRTYLEIVDNLRLRAAAETELAEKRKTFAEDEIRLNQQLNLLTRQPADRGGITTEEAVRRMTELQQKNAAALTETQLKILGLATAYEELVGQVESYSKQLQESFVAGFADALTQTITDFKNAGAAWVSLSQSIANQIVGIFVQAFTQRLFAKMGLFSFVDQLMNRIFGGGGGGGGGGFVGGMLGSGGYGESKMAEGGPVTGPGTGTSDSILARVSAGEHIMPASKAARWMPLLEGIRMGTIAPAFALGGVVGLQSIADLSLIPRRYANGGVVVSDGGASQVTPGGGGVGNMVVTMHPDTLNMTMREWLEHEVVRQQGRR